MRSGSSLCRYRAGTNTPDNDPASEAYQTLKATSEQKVRELKALSDIHEAKPAYLQLLANASAAREGVVDGANNYLPYFGELGKVLSEVDIDPLALMNALATGDIHALEKHFQQWPNRAKAGYEAASESMEALILLLSDTRTRELLMSLPARYLAAMPEPELVKIAASQGTQTTMDVGATTVGTAAAGPLGVAVVGSLALLRKGGKAAEGLIKLLNELVVVLKKKRNKYNEKDQQHSQTPLGGKKKQSDDENEKDSSGENLDNTTTEAGSGVPSKLIAAQRIGKLDLEGHAPIRHGGPDRVTGQQLEDRAVRGIDPASGTILDAFNKFPNGSFKPHKVGRNATAFTSDDALLRADDFARSSTQFQKNITAARENGDLFVDAVELPLKDVFGSSYQNSVRGVTRLGGKNNPTGHVPTDFTDGTIKAIYRLDQKGNVRLHTLYPNPKP